MTISVIDPIGRAFERTTKILFQPFDLTKWLTLGFCAWLATLGEGGGGGGGGGVPRDDSTDVPDLIARGETWVAENTPLVIGIAVAVVVCGLLLAALVLWLKARGRFMFIDGIAHDRGAVKEPWRVFRDVARRVFVFEFALTLAVGMALSLAVAGGLFLAWDDLHAGQFHEGALAGVVFGGSLFLATALVGGLVGWVLDQFLVPALYLHGGSVGDAWSAVREELFAGNLGAIVLYFLMRVVLVIAVSCTALCVTCATCCLTVIPYVGTVILLPLLVFLRCYNLSFIEQFGERWGTYRFDLVTARDQ